MIARNILMMTMLAQVQVERPWKTQSTTSKSHDLLFELFMDRDKTKVHMMTAEDSSVL